MKPKTKIQKRGGKTIRHTAPHNRYTRALGILAML